MKTQKHGVELGEGPGEKKTFFRNLLFDPLMMSFFVWFTRRMQQGDEEHTFVCRIHDPS